MDNNTGIWAEIEKFSIESKNAGDSFVIQVSLPQSYTAGGKKYPVLYCLDSDGSFGLAVSALNYINLGANFGMGKNIPEMIIVGIGYERGLIPWLFTRVRDFSPTEDPSFNYNNPSFKIPESGKADNFLKFIKEELQPKLESKYRTDSEMNIVASHSMSALFAVYGMFQSKRFFHKYIMACPFIEWNGDTVFRMEELFSVKNQELPADAFFCITGHEPTPTYIENTRKFIAILKKRNYRDFNFHLETYSNDNHFSVWPKAFIDGLAYIFSSR